MITKWAIYIVLVSGGAMLFQPGWHWYTLAGFGLLFVGSHLLDNVCKKANIL